MNILLCGATGFVGRHIEAGLLQAGHSVIRGVRHPLGVRDVSVDYRNDIHISTWLPRLEGIDVVINAVGVLRDSPSQPMSVLHDATPRALFAAAAQRGIKRIVQISALGVGTGIAVPYMSSKQAADDFLQTLDLDWTILRPSLIYGADGASTKMFMRLAMLPVFMLPSAGKQMVQPVHVDELALAIVHLLALPEGTPPLRSVIDCVGPESVSLADLISSYRTQSGKSSPTILSVPAPMLWLMSMLGDRIPAMPLGSDTLAMLNVGSTGDSQRYSVLLGRTPRRYQNFLGQVATD